MPSRIVQLNGRRLSKETLKKYLENKGWQNIRVEKRRFAKGTSFIQAHRDTDSLYGRITKTTFFLSYSNETSKDEFHDLEEILR